MSRYVIEKRYTSTNKAQALRLCFVVAIGLSLALGLEKLLRIV